MRHITVTSSCNRCLENTIFQGHGGFLGNSPSHSLFMHCKKKKFLYVENEKQKLHQSVDWSISRSEEK